jgi:hypothetical protein
MVGKLVRNFTMLDSNTLAEIRSSLFEYQPDLHLLISEGKIEISGVFIVYSSNKKVLDRYKISINIPCTYPVDLPIVRETGGRIPREGKYHINDDGTACVFLPEERWRSFPVGDPFSTYLNIPLHNFFLGQTVYQKEGRWPFGEWGHGLEGIYEYYFWLLNIQDKNSVHRFLHILSKHNFKKHYECPCGSELLIRKCCIEKIRDLRLKISPDVAKKSIKILGDRDSTYKRSRFTELGKSSAGSKLPSR